MTHDFLDPDRPVDLISDGLGLSPAETGRLLACLHETRTIEVDTYLEGGTVAELESKIAARLGKEAGLYVPTGTLANHLALTGLTREGEAVLVDGTSHVARDAGQSLTRWSGRPMVQLHDDRAGYTVAAVCGALENAATGKVPGRIGALSLESPMRRRHGEMIADDRMAALCSLARENDIALHLDAARLFIGCGWTGADPADVAAPFDTVYVSLWKCFNAPSGAVLVGERRLIDRLRPLRRAMGGCPPHGWPSAAIALYYLEQDCEPFRAARAAGETLHAALASDERLRLETVPNGTSITFVHGATAEGKSTKRVIRAGAFDASGRVALRMNPSLIGREPETMASEIIASLTGAANN